MSERTRRFVLAGSPVAHSRSPAMHAAAFAALGLPHTYEARDVDAAGLEGLVVALRERTIDGLNVTLPHKLRALSLADATEEVARAAGAANTLYRDEGGRVVATNTDVPALAAELADLGARVRGARALVIGGGGGARAAVLALGSLGARAVVVRARAPERAASLVSLLGAGVVSVEALRAAPDDDFAVIVQATSAGMHGPNEAAGPDVAAAVDWSSVPDSTVAYDLVYAPVVTPFGARAEARGLTAASGLGMLARQGALAFERWLGVAAPLAAMRAALGG
ncbi:MAG: shikimate dehydrogenase [Polyangiaceae bacterium]